MGVRQSADPGPGATPSSAPDGWTYRIKRFMGSERMEAVAVCAARSGKVVVVDPSRQSGRFALRSLRVTMVRALRMILERRDQPRSVLAVQEENVAVAWDGDPGRTGSLMTWIGCRWHQFGFPPASGQKHLVTERTCGLRWRGRSAAAAHLTAYLQQAFPVVSGGRKSLRRSERRLGHFVLWRRPPPFGQAWTPGPGFGRGWSGYRGDRFSSESGSVFSVGTL
jgi:hypothetical protein